MFKKFLEALCPFCRARKKLTTLVEKAMASVPNSKICVNCNFNEASDLNDFCESCSVSWHWQQIITRENKTLQ